MHMCRNYLNERISFGRKLADHQMVQKNVAENVARIHAGNLMTLHCAQLLSGGGEPRVARAYSSMCKNHVARALCQVLDDANHSSHVSRVLFAVDRSRCGCTCNVRIGWSEFKFGLC